MVVVFKPLHMWEYLGWEGGTKITGVESRYEKTFLVRFLAFSKGFSVSTPAVGPSTFNVRVLYLTLKNPTELSAFGS